SREAMSSRVRCAKPSSRNRVTSWSNSCACRAVVRRLTALVIREIVLQYRFQYCFRTEESVVPVERLLPTPEAYDLIDLTRDVADKVLAPRVDEHERNETFPDGVFPALGAAGLLSLPYPEEF